MTIGEKSRFFIVNLFKGLIWFALLIVIFILVKKYSNIDHDAWLEPVFRQTWLIITIYFLSELIIGIIPPELFMIWALRTGNLTDYALLVSLFAILSYIAGFLGFLFGKYLDSTKIFRYLRRRYLGKYHTLLRKFGVFMILVAALTPVPYSGISILIGSLNYPVKKYLLWALSRFVKFSFYAALIWEANII
jgi:membrane protein YqaA with SNARE-associated domain